MSSNATKVAKLWAKNIALMTGFFTTSEVFQQKVIFKKKEINWKEVKNLGIAISCWSAPVNCFWYFKVLDRLVPGGKSVKVVLLRSFLDPIIALPISVVGSFTILDFLAGKGDIFDQVKSKFVQTCYTGFLFWFPVQIINFRFFPVHLRVAYVSVTAFAWSNIFCYIKNFEKFAELGKRTKEENLEEKVAE